MSGAYLYPVPGTRWAISRLVEGRWVYLVQDSRLDTPADAEAVLRALGVPTTAGNLDYYFPVRIGLGRCPTLALLERCNVLDPSNPMARQQGAREAGV